MRLTLIPLDTPSDDTYGDCPITLGMGASFHDTRQWSQNPDHEDWIMKTGCGLARGHRIQKDDLRECW